MGVPVPDRSLAFIQAIRVARVTLGVSLFCAFSHLAVANTEKSSNEKQRSALLAIDFKKYFEGLPEGQSVEKMDSQGKGISDMISVFQRADNGDRILVRQLFDINRDGKIDLANTFAKGKRIKSEFDLDFDGRVDSVNDFNPETGELERKVMMENNALTWLYWFKNELRRKEVDRNGDDRPDMWVHYRNGRVVKTEIDVNYDGKNIRVEGDLSKGRSQ